jgi:hypothetical protein
MLCTWAPGELITGDGKPKLHETAAYKALYASSREKQESQLAILQKSPGNSTKDRTRSCDANSSANLTPSLRIPASSTKTHASQHEAFVCHAVCISTILTRRQRGLTVTVTPNKRWRQKPIELNRPIYPLRESFAASAIQHATDPPSR